MVAIRPWVWKAAALVISWAVAFYLGSALKQGQWDRQVARETATRNSALVKGMANSYGLGLRYEMDKGAIYERFDSVEKQVGQVTADLAPTGADIEWRKLLNRAAAGALPAAKSDGASATVP